MDKANMDFRRGRMDEWMDVDIRKRSPMDVYMRENEKDENVKTPRFPPLLKDSKERTRA